jgi:copper chaperone CopZ
MILNRIQFMKTIFLTLVFAAFIGFVHAAGPQSKRSTIIIHTSAVCDMCDATIKQALKKVKGVKSASLDVPSKDVTVIYDPRKTDPDAIRKAISMAGYDADNVAANQEAYDNLDPCCRKGAHD